MNLRLLLVDDDGNLVERWNVDQDFGDLSQPLPKVALAEAVAGAVEHIRRAGTLEDFRTADRKRFDP